MTLFRRLAVVLLAALWLPATSHCRLEGAGLIFAADCCSGQEHATEASDAHGCADDGCEVVERGYTAPTSASLKLSAPTTGAMGLPVSDAPAALSLAPPPDGGVRESTAAPPGAPTPARLILPGTFAPQAP